MPTPPLSTTIGSLLTWTLLESLIAYVIVKNFNGKLTKPTWKEDPFKLTEPFIALQFLGYGAIFMGLSYLIGVFMKYLDLSMFGLQNLFTGVGILLSMKLTKKILTMNNSD